ncbi:hypothetical protein NA56DRAFT_745949 [Hyaloscypha hepaticicola]|uniref:F-box domain-containing protein n=1 Tax=Hyaloscypha hepaticicola TaxID=2082293 RepID=A0A2J6QE68_9HELO|nr:hypothetical protein NA56DRAFT_745949 [Hyaloscypha hepaticicola]
MASKSPIELADLPNEIITAILSLFPTRALLPLTPLSHRIHALILTIIHTRITTLTSSPSSSKQKVILECYHPSAKLSTPYFFCDYLYTEPFSLTSPSTSASSKLQQLRDLYTHYKPTPPEGDRKVWRPRPAGGWSWVPISDVLGNGEEGAELVSQDIYLESHELFSQLMSVVNVVKTGPKKDLFLSCVTVGEGLVRVWRDWLAARAEDFREGRDGEGREDGKGLLWSSVDRHVGLRLKVLEREDMVRDRGPVLVSRDEDPNVGYTLQYEDLVVRSTQLLLMIEDSMDREVGNTGKAIVIVS